MKNISRDTLELILKTFESVSTDETRLYLNAVRIGKSKQGENIAEATDGHILTRHFVEDEMPNEDILIDRVGKAKLKSFLSSNKDCFHFLVDYNVEENSNLRIFTGDERDGVILPVIFRDYPKTCGVIPTVKTESDYIEFGINPSLLAKLYKSMNGEKKRQVVRLKVRKDSPDISPILVESGNNNLGLIMPVRV